MILSSDFAALDDEFAENAVSKNTNNGEVELSTPAMPLGTCCAPHASTSQATLLLSRDCTKSSRHDRLSVGKCSPRRRITASKKSAARVTRMAISVTGEMVASAIFISRYDDPHRQASAPNNTNSVRRLCGAGMGMC